MNPTARHLAPALSAPAAGNDRLRRAGQASILLAVAGLSAIPFATGHLGPLSIALAAVLACACALRHAIAIQMALIALALALQMQVPALRVASLPLILTLAVFALVVLTLAPLRRSCDWLQRGLLDRRAGWQIAGIAVVSSAALLAWHALTHPDVGPLKAMFSGMPTAAVIAAGVIFPLVNATVEEAIYRGVMMSALGQVFRSVLLVNLVQALSFGLLHKDGFPSGAWGIALATLYAALLGMLRHHTRGLLAPWIAHVLTDATIFLIVLNLA